MVGIPSKQFLHPEWGAKVQGAVVDVLAAYPHDQFGTYELVKLAKKAGLIDRLLDDDNVARYIEEIPTLRPYRKCVSQHLFEWKWK